MAVVIEDEHKSRGYSVSVVNYFHRGLNYPNTTSFMSVRLRSYVHTFVLLVLIEYMKSC